VRRSRFIGVGSGIGIDSPDAIVSVCATQRCPFDSDSDPDPEAYDIHAGSG
jgi:hypothetical protein